MTKTKTLLQVTFLILLICCIAPSFLLAQEVHTFNIESFTMAVEESNLQIKIAKKEKAFVDVGKNEALAAYLPQVNFQGQYQRNFNDQKMYIEFPDFANMDAETGEIPVTLQQFDIGFKNDFQANFLLEQNILSLKSICEIKAARIHSKIGELDYKWKTEEITNSAKKMFLQAVLLKHVHQLNLTSEQNALENYKTAKIKFENRLISEMDLLQAKLRWENEIPKTQKAKRNAHILLNNLKVISGISSADSIILDYDFAVGGSQEVVNRIDEVFARREDYQMLAQHIELQKALIEKEKAEYMPYIKAQLGYSYMSNSDKWKLDEYVNKPFYAGLTLTIPIVSGGYRKTQVSKAKLQYDISKFQKEDAQQNITIEVRNLEMKLKEEASIIKSAQSTLETAQRSYSLAEKNTETGLISQLDLRRYSEDLKAAQLNLYYSIYNYECSQIDYIKAVGKK